MMTISRAVLLAASVALAGPVSAQTSPSAPLTTPPAAGAPPVVMDPAVEAKFKAADKSGKGMIEGTALEPFKTVMPQVDTDKDGKISRAEFAAAAKSGLIK